MTLVDLPTVSKMELEYRYPAYTGLPPQKIENGGDVAALRGTEVFLHIVPTMNTPSGRILVNESESRPLTRQADGSLTGSFMIDKQGFYRIELEGPARRAGHRVAAVHDRRHRRSRADRVVPQAGTRHDGDGRSKSCSSRPRPRTTSA